MAPSPPRLSDAAGLLDRTLTADDHAGMTWWNAKTNVSAAGGAELPARPWWPTSGPRTRLTARSAPEDYS